MPGIHFNVVLSESELDVLAERAVQDAADRLAAEAFRSLDGVPAPEAAALADLHALLLLQRAADRLSQRAARAAVRAGAGYPDLAAALVMTRQGARKRFPRLVSRRAAAPLRPSEGG